MQADVPGRHAMLQPRGSPYVGSHAEVQNLGEDWTAEAEELLWVELS